MIEYERIPGQREYQPGACNIGTAEAERRRRVGFVSLAAAVVLGAVLVLLGGPRGLRLLTAAPLSFAFLGFMQARCRFCVGYGISGLQNMDESGAVRRVEDPEARAADRRRALFMQVVATTVGFIAASLFALAGKSRPV